MQDATKHATGGVPASRGAEWIHHHLNRIQPGASTARLDVDTDSTASIPAYVNHGRWVVDCPDCNNAQLACRTDHRFLCNECGNASVSGLWRPVIWPADAKGIEAALTRRPAGNQNWEPWQTVGDLDAETAINTLEI